jgi:hypothetical protein
MTNEYLDQWLKFNKNMNFNVPFSSLGKNINHVFSTVLDNNLRCFSECVTNTCKSISSQLRCLNNTSKAEDLMGAQKECISEGISATISNMQNIINTSMENADIVSHLYSTAKDEFTKEYKSKERMSEK